MRRGRERASEAVRVTVCGVLDPSSDLIAVSILEEYDFGDLPSDFGVS
jgi:hypothetical protein